MTKYILDIETTTTKMPDGKTNPSPYLHTNSLVSVGLKNVESGYSEYLFFNHNELTERSFKEPERLQEVLDSATLIIGHNLKFDMAWLYECGFKYEGSLYDTMIFEYIAAKGRKPLLSLGDCAIRYGLTPKKDIMKEYFKQGYNTDQIPMKELEEYGLGDIETTYELYQYQRKRYTDDAEIRTMWPAMKLSMETLEVLIDIERAGIPIDTAALADVEETFRKEKMLLEQRMNDLIRDVMGDTKINLASPADMSMVVYGRKVKDKKLWAETFNIGTEQKGSVKKQRYNRRYKEGEFKQIIRNQTDPVYRTDAVHCQTCDGKGVIQKYKKDKIRKKTGEVIKGEPYKNTNICPDCRGDKVLYIPNGKRAGFIVKPISSEYATVNGFSTDKTTIDDLIAMGNLSLQAEEFLRALQRVNALDTYLTSFVEGIKKSTGADGLNHPNYNQCVTATARLSSSNPNWQNQPRGGTFPIRRAVKSRWKEGILYPTDFAALEYRVAVLLANCPAGLKSLVEKKDRHEMSAEYIFKAKKAEMEPTEWKEIRQKAKGFCVPLHSRALTRDGWKGYNELVIGEDILAYDPELRVNVWTPLLEKVYWTDQEVIEMQNLHNFSVQATSNHRWYGAKVNWKNKMVDCVFTTKEMNKSHRIYTSAPLKERTTSPLTLEEVALLAWLWTDGSLHVSKYTGRTSQAKGRRQGMRALIIQKKEAGIADIERILKTLNIPYSKSLRKDSSGCFVFNLSAPHVRDLYKKACLDLENPDKVKFVLGLGKEQAEAFLNACVLAEGTIRDRGQVRIAQNVGTMKEAMQLAAYICGYDVRVTITKKEKNPKANFDHATLNLRTRPYVNGTRITKKSLGKMDVWCPRTKYGTWVMRQGETITITGNTFRPLFSGVGQTEETKAYTEAFFKEHTGIAKWHENLGKEALTTKQIVTPSGRIFAFPEVKRNDNGRIQGLTQITNYPVQSFSADLVWSVIIPLWREMKALGLKSKLIMQTHDDVVPDVHPDEKEVMLELVKKHFHKTTDYLTERFGYVTTVPIGFEISEGVNLLEKKTIYEYA